MKDLEWKYVKHINDKEVVLDFLKKYNVNLPSKLVECLILNNGGRPSEKIFNTEIGNEYVFKALLSYNENDLETIYKVYPMLFDGTSLYPIGTDASGNFVCYDYYTDEYILVNHEKNCREKIISSGF